VAVLGGADLGRYSRRWGLPRVYRRVGR
jgi:hypothetical protein